MSAQHSPNIEPIRPRRLRDTIPAPMAQARARRVSRLTCPDCGGTRAAGVDGYPCVCDGPLLMDHGNVYEDTIEAEAPAWVLRAEAFRRTA